MIKLSILILTVPGREAFLDDLIKSITSQPHSELVQIAVNDDPTGSIGQKRNNVLRAAQGEYVCFIDDDDSIAPDYISTILEALKENPECLSLRGVITHDGQNPEIFEHSLRYKAWRTVQAGYSEVKYQRYPNHLNVIRADIAKQFMFPETNYGEDRAWSDLIYNSGILKNEVYIDKIIYYYKYRSKK